MVESLMMRVTENRFVQITQIPILLSPNKNNILFFLSHGRIVLKNVLRSLLKFLSWIVSLCP